jgi:hypothetical protein
MNNTALAGATSDIDGDHQLRSLAHRIAGGLQTRDEKWPWPGRSATFLTADRTSNSRAGLSPNSDSSQCTFSGS